ncbi:DoxX family protein [Pannus brasiliensis CCIBt3594]|uniref:DoxX family protein n=1 Tax=Pannus brasiliensis CCIBt3594 TaxID=1427578 RepID=A0AAW9QIR4_9CHRO
MNNYTSLFGRIFLSAIFLKSGWDKLLDPNSTVQYMSAKGIPFANILIIPTIGVLLAGGLSVLLGYKAKLGAWLLIGFLVPATLIFHTRFPEEEIDFLKNLGLMGGLLTLVTYGAGKWSLDRRTKPQYRSLKDSPLTADPWDD